MITLSSIRSWLMHVGNESKLTYRFIPLGKSNEWIYQKGALQHISGHFFYVVAVRWKSNNGSTIIQPLIKQEEIGTLGFLLRRHKDKNEILVQAKVEPGNMGIAQIAPTCQATASNMAQVHHGDLPPFVEWFKSESYMCSSLQSEQGTRFFGKRNRNILRYTDKPITETATHRWMQVDKILKLVHVDFLINTDARSVIVCSQWEKLVNRIPFSKYKTAFAKELAHSYQSKKKQHSLSFLYRYINSIRKKTSRPKIIPLARLVKWDVTKQGIVPRGNRPFAIRQIQVSVKGREVPHWDQPIIDSVGEGKIDLVCGRLNGVLCFLFKLQEEPGLYNKVEFGPTFCNSPGFDHPDITLPKKYIVRASSKQSEEGGRFFKDVNQYRIIDVGQITQLKKDDIWLTLWQIQRLLLKEGLFTNEARSAIILLLKWL